MPDTLTEQPPEITGINRTGEEELESKRNTKNENIHALGMKRFQFAYEAGEEDRDNATEDQEFRNGKQWPVKYENERNDAGLPCLKSNRLNTFIDQVIGDERQNRPQIKVLPGNKDSDPHVAEILNGKIREIENSSFADVAYDSSVESSTGCGRGFFRVVNKYEDNETFDQVLRIKRIADCMSVVEDPAATEVDGSDGMYKFVSGLIPESEFKEMWPKAIPVSFDVSSESTDYWLMDGMVRVAEYWYKQPDEKYTLYRYFDGTKYIVSKDANLKGIDGEKLEVVAKRDVKKMRVYWCIMSGKEILDGPHEWVGEHIPIIPVWGKELWVKGKRHTFGLIRFAKDEQRLLNYSKSTEAELLVKAPKIPFIGTEPMFKNHETLWNTADRRNVGALIYNIDPANPQAKPERADPIPAHAGVQIAQQNAIEGMKGTTGIWNPGLGKPDSSVTSGVQVAKLQQEADTSTFAYIDNLSRALCYLGVILLDLIPKFYPEYQEMRLMAEDGSVSWESVNLPVFVNPQTGKEVDKAVAAQNPGMGVPSVRNDLTKGKYTVTVTTGPSYKTQKIEAAQNLATLMQALLPEQKIAIAGLMVGSQDYPKADVAMRRLEAMVDPRIIAAGEGKDISQIDQPGLVDQYGNPMPPQPGQPMPMPGQMPQPAGVQ